MMGMRVDVGLWDCRFGNDVEGGREVEEVG